MRHAFFHTGERGVIARFTQLGQIRLREALVLASQRIREGNILDEALFNELFQRLLWLPCQCAARVHVGYGEFIEALRLTCSEIEYS